MRSPYQGMIAKPFVFEPGRAFRIVAPRFLWACLFLFVPMIVQATESQTVFHKVPVNLLSLQAVGRLAPSRELNLAIVLPLRNQDELTNLLGQLYDPSDPNFHHYLKPAQFAERFAPTAKDYDAVIDFASRHGLLVTGTHPNRMIVDLKGSVADVEKTFHVVLRQYRHPTETRTFYAPDINPVVDLAVPILEIQGLDDCMLPRPMFHHLPVPRDQGSLEKPAAGAGPYGTFMGGDFRSAYVPGESLTGAGQQVGLFELDGYYANDPAWYASQAGLTNVIAPTNVLVDGFDGTPGPNNIEVALDIEMVMCMAPGAQIVVYEGSTTVPTIVIDVLNRMATDNLAGSISSSWTYPTGPAMDQVYQQMAAQGQSYFNCSGDHGAYSATVATPADNPYVTSVGGTTLSTAGPGSNWVSEVAWNWGNGDGTGGGISTVRPIPAWQQGVSMVANGGSATLRNLPDVAMVADAVYAVAGNGQPHYLGGTSISAPLWAAFTALVNQKASLQAKATVGFLNPALYAIARSTNYSASFHDILSGSNTNSASPTNFFAVSGYDLCTGWGSPTTNLIDALLNVQFVLPNGWTVTSLANQSWSGVASSADGTKLAAVDLSGAHQINLSVTAGATWRSYGPAASWRGIASSADGTRLAAAPWDGPIYLSTNSGVSWTASASPSYSWRSMACSADGTKLATGAAWEGVVEVSTNSGAAWFTAPGAPGGFGWMPVGWSADGAVLISASGNQVFVSTNGGVSGTTTTIGNVSFACVAASGDGSTLVAAGTSAICVSTNRGATWVITSAPAQVWSSVACSADGYRIIGAPSGGNISLSEDRGTTWLGIGPRSASWSSVACSTDGQKLIVAANNYLDGPVYTGVFPRSGPSITAPPGNQTVVVGGNAVFTVVAFGPPPMTYQWSFNGTNLVGATNSSLVLTNLQFSQAGYYGVQVSDAFGSRFSPNAALTIQPPPAAIVTQPTNQTAVLGTTVNFAVLAAGTPPLTYQWLFNGINLPAATNSVLTLTGVQSTNAGIYAVTVGNAYGSVTSSNAVLTLIASTPCLAPPSNLVGWWPADGNPADRSGINDGTSVGNISYGPGCVSQCWALDGNGSGVALGSRPDLQLFGFTIEMWIRRASPSLSSQSGGKAMLFSFGADGLGIFDNGTLFWQMGPGYGSGGVIADTNWHLVAVTVTTSGDTIYIDGTVRGSSLGPQSVNFTNVAIGARGDNLANGFYGSIDEVALFNRVLTASEISGIYNAGGYGMCWRPAPPCITSQPNGKTIKAGQSASFGVTVAGWQQSLGYQWVFNGASLAGQTTSTLFLSNVQWNQAGSYAVVITNAFGMVVSSNAMLVVQVTNPPVLSPALVVSNGVLRGMVTGASGPIGIEASTNLVSWINLTNLILSNGAVPFVDPTAINSPQRFYRARNQ